MILAVELVWTCGRRAVLTKGAQGFTHIRGQMFAGSGNPIVRSYVIDGCVGVTHMKPD